MSELKWINSMKGIGILAVVVGHIYYGITVRIIFLFHMPLFFFMSGYLFQTKTNFKKYFYDKTIHLLVPYFCFLIPLYLLFNHISVNLISFKIIIRYLHRAVIGGRGLGGALGPFWFVTCLFLVQQLSNIILVKVNVICARIFIFFMLVLSYVNSILFPGFWLPLNANVVLHALPIFYIGYLFKNININSFYLLLAVILVVFCTVYYPQNTYNMKYSSYGIPFVTLISSIVLVLVIKYLSIIVLRVGLLSFFLIELGKSSMVIMFMHQPIQILVKNYLTSDYTIRFILSTLGSYCIYLLFSRFMLSRALLLGSKNDFETIKFKVIKN